jgi:hypothetical protein
MIANGYEDLLLTGSNFESSGASYDMAAQDDGFSPGSPEPIEVAVQRWMADGAVASTQGFGNRTITFNVIVSATNSSDLAAGEAALARRSAGSILLKWVPPQGEPDAPATVFEVWTWHLDPAFSVDREMRISRMYTVTATAKPAVRSEGLTVVDALPTVSTPTTISIDDCTSMTNWTGFSDYIIINNPRTESGAIKIFGFLTTGFAGLNLPPKTATRMSLTRTAHVDMGSQPYLVLDTTNVGLLPNTFLVNVDGQPCTRIAALGSASYWQLPVGKNSFDTLYLEQTFSLVTGSPTIISISMEINEIFKTDSVGGVGSRMQLQRSFPVGGSVKTSGSIQLASPTANGLGNVLVYTRSAGAAGYVPALRQYRTSGGTVTADPLCVSGFRETFVTNGASVSQPNYFINSNQLREGTYAVVGRFKTNAPGVAMSVAVYAQNTATTYASISKTITFPSTGSFVLASIGTMSLPVQRLPAESAVPMYLSIVGSGGGGQQWLDEIYLLDVTRGDVTIINAGSYTRMWVDSADVDTSRNQPAVYLGNSSTRGDAVSVTSSQIVSLGPHELDPVGASMLTVTDGVLNAVVTAAFYKRWHTNAGE